MPANPDPLAEKIQFDKPHPARVWNYFLGGKDNYPADREVGDAVNAADPGFPLLARQVRQFLVRAVRYLAGEAGVRQFLDIGTGLPTEQNTHEVAQAVAPDSKIVYVDNDPLVLTHARALLTNTTDDGVTSYIHADVREPDTIIADARNVLNFRRPMAVMLLGILGHAAPEFDTMRSIVARLVDAVPAGSYLVLLDGVRTDNDAYLAAIQTSFDMGNRYHLRTLEQFTACFEGLHLLDPGVVPCNFWRPDDIEVGSSEPCSAHCAVGLKV